MEDIHICVSCPHCYNYIIIYKKDINCAIFRHGIFKDSYKQITPHLSKVECDDLSAKSKIYGCGKPFRLIQDDQNNYQAEVCGYI